MTVENYLLFQSKLMMNSVIIKTASRNLFATQYFYNYNKLQMKTIKNEEKIESKKVK